MELIKQVDEEKREALFLVLSPEEEDAHGDIYDAETIRKAAKDFHDNQGSANLLHLVNTTEPTILESYISPVDMLLGETEVKKGSWLQKWYFPETEIGEIIWQGVKDGYFTGLSVGCFGEAEDIDG